MREFHYTDHLCDYPEITLEEVGAKWTCPVCNDTWVVVGSFDSHGNFIKYWNIFRG